MDPKKINKIKLNEYSINRFNFKQDTFNGILNAFVEISLDLKKKEMYRMERIFN